MKNGNIRKLKFEPNKVNVITGGPTTGKTVIWAIIDYCLFASEPRIPEKIINENVAWYGINFNINKEHFTICRKSNSADGIASNEYYFSGSGEIPELPTKSISDIDLKSLIDVEFNIHDKVVIPYGGKLLKQGTKISMRYFLLFNSQNENTITNSETFFDKQTESRYKEALERIFDLVIGIDSVEDTLIKEQIYKLETELKRCEKRISAYNKENHLFEKNMQQVLKTAKEHGLINEVPGILDEEITELKKVVFEQTRIRPSTDITEYERLEKEQWEIVKKIKNLKKFEREYNNYKEVLELNYDSLKPINYIHDNYSEIIDVPLVLEFVGLLKMELSTIKQTITKKSPIRVDVKSKITELNIALKKIQTEMERYPRKINMLTGDQEKYILIGEIKTKIEFYEKKIDDESPDGKILILNNELDELKRKLGRRDEKKAAVMRLLEDLIQNFLDQSGDALENYKGYKAAFDHREKELKLQEPNSTKVERVVGSSSNHLFLHLSLFLGLHELFIRQRTPYIPSFLFLDQPSRPYYDNSKEKIKDRLKITTAFALMNDFITHINVELNQEFQFIVVEHIPKEIWEEAEMENVYLVEEFTGSNKLIREEDKLSR
jgi:tetratricopeptide (TPR) repeat protein